MCVKNVTPKNFLNTNTTIVRSPLKQLKNNDFSQIRYNKCINNNINKLYTFNKKTFKGQA